MDVCESAFKCIDGKVNQTFLHPGDDLPSDHFDIVYSFLVTQHMPEDDILLQFPNVIRSLKRETGRFFVQFAGSTVKDENNIKIRDTCVDERGVNTEGIPPGIQRMVRTKEYAKKLTRDCGGTVIRVAGDKDFAQFKSYWYYLAVKRV